MNTKYLSTALAILLTGVVGCGTNVPLKGKVTFSDDGSPLTGGMVLFDSGSTTAKASINNDGTFVVGYKKAKDGIPPGTYRVAIVGAREFLPCPENEDDNPRNNIYPPPSVLIFDPRFEQVETSGLSVTVDNSMRKIEFSVDRPKKKK